MPLSAPTLAAAIKTNIEAIPGIIISKPEELEKFCTAVATAVVTHITGSAVVMPTALTWPGGLVPAPVVGTGTIL